jgi:hypothetical protein
MRSAAVSAASTERHRNPHVAQQLVGQFLVAGGFHGNVRGAPRHRRPDALLVFAVAQLHQTLVVQPDRRNAAAARFVHDGLRARSQRQSFRHPNQRVQFLGVVERLDVPIVVFVVGQQVQPRDAAQFLWQQMLNQSQREATGLQPDALLQKGVHDIIFALFAPRGAGLAVGHVDARQRLQFDGDMLGDVSQPRSFVKPPYEASRLAIRAAVCFERGNIPDEPVRELWQLRGGIFFQRFQVQRQPNHRTVAVHVRTTIHTRFTQAHTSSTDCRDYIGAFTGLDAFGVEQVGRLERRGRHRRDHRLPVVDVEGVSVRQDMD